MTSRDEVNRLSRIKADVAKVEVAPIAVPLANGRMKLGAAAEEAGWTASNYRSSSSFPPVGW